LQPEYFEDWMVALRRELYPPESKMHRKEFEETIQKMRMQQEREQLAILEKSQASRTAAP